MSKKAKVKNTAQVAKGKVQVSVSQTTGDRQLEVEGDVDQMRGNLKQAGEHVKDAFKK